MSVKKFIVDLTDQERDICREVVKKLKGTSQKVKRANILLKSDPKWTDAKIAEASIAARRPLRTCGNDSSNAGFELTLNGKAREKPPVEKLLDGEQEAKIIALRLGAPPNGFGKWTLRLLARKVVEMEIAESVSYQTIRRTLKKTKCAPAATSSTG